jgi:hypothetical protein
MRHRRARAGLGDSAGASRREQSRLIRIVVLCALVACGDRTQPAELAPYLTTLAGAGEATRTREVASWWLDEAAWRRVVVEPYRELHAEYTRAFATATPRLVAQLATSGAIATRAHYADDPKLTTGEARTRWALPVAYASQVAAKDGVPFDAVFLRDGGRWHAIVGLDTAIRAHIAGLDPACAELLDIAQPPRRCREVAWALADAALRSDRARFTHACTLAQTVCAKPSP